MSSVILYVIVSTLIQVTMLVGIFGTFKTPKLYVLKGFISLIAYIGHYLFLATGYNMILNNSGINNQFPRFALAIASLLSGTFALVLFTKWIVLIKKDQNKYDTFGDKLDVIGVIVGLFFSFVEIYFALYLFDNDWFMISSSIEDNGLKVAFEFVYYAFSVTITYSGSGIEAAGIIPKVFQMFHVVYFYFFAGSTIIQILHRHSECED